MRCRTYSFNSRDCFSHRPSLTCRSSTDPHRSPGSDVHIDGSWTRRQMMQQMCIQGTLTLGSIISPWAKPVCPAWAAPPGPRMPTHEVQAALDAALAQVVVKGKAPVLLRLAFHDAGTFDKAAGNGGMNASIGFELDRPESFGLKRGWNLVIRLEESLKGTPAEGQVSRADLIALMGAAAVSVTGGPRIAVPIGRSDALGPDPEGRLPAETLTAPLLKEMFQSKGLSVREMVALSGAHTIGGKGFGAPDVFDNAYYTALLRRPWLDTKDGMASMIGLPSDHVLPDDKECLPFIQEFSADQNAFFMAFSEAYSKMTGLGVVWRP